MLGGIALILSGTFVISQCQEKHQTEVTDALVDEHQKAMWGIQTEKDSSLALEAKEKLIADTWTRAEEWLEELIYWENYLSQLLLFMNSFCFLLLLA